MVLVMTQTPDKEQTEAMEQLEITLVRFNKEKIAVIDTIVAPIEIILI